MGEGRQFPTESGEQPVEVAAAGAGFVFIEQGVVRLGLVADRVGLAALERDHPFQPRQEAPEVRTPSGGGPFRLGQRRDAGRLLDQRLRQPRQPGVLPPPFADVDRRIGERIANKRGIIHIAEQVVEARLGGLLVLHAGEEGELVGAVGGPAGRQVGLLVPGQQGGARPQQRPLAGQPDQFVVGLYRFHAAPFVLL